MRGFNKGIISSYLVLGICPNSSLPPCMTQQEKNPSLTPGLPNSLCQFGSFLAQEENYSVIQWPKSKKLLRICQSWKRVAIVHYWSPLCFTASQGWPARKKQPWHLESMALGFQEADNIFCSQLISWPHFSDENLGIERKIHASQW